MLTPRFTLSQDDDYVIAQIDAPYVKFSEGEMCLQGNKFSFYCKPYHLKLYFSGQISEDGTENAKYDVETRAFTIHIPKMSKGENFRDLDMLTKLITPPVQRSVKASAVIEVLNSTRYEKVSEEDIDWSAEQVLSTEHQSDVTILSANMNYGFNLKDAQVFTKLQEECHEILDITNPDETPLNQRPVLQIQEEADAFNSEHYLADWEDDEFIQEFIIYKSSIDRAYHKCIEESISGDDLITYTSEEVEDLLRLPKKEYLLDCTQTQSALLGLVDIMFACLYDLRTTMEESTVESAWTIRKLSSTLSWLVQHTAVKPTLSSCVRRVLCYPLYRHWILAMKILDDLYMALCLGKKQILRCMLHVLHVFNNSDPHHIFNGLYITDMCVWVQTVPNKTLKSLAEQIRQCQLSKDHMQLDLLALEAPYESYDDDAEESSDSNVGKQTNVVVSGTDSSDDDISSTDRVQLSTEVADCENETWAGKVVDSDVELATSASEVSETLTDNCESEKKADGSAAACKLVASDSDVVCSGRVGNGNDMPGNEAVSNEDVTLLEQKVSDMRV